MAILITGGAGFVGLNVAEFLCDRGESVVLFGPSPPPAGALTALQKRRGCAHFAAGDVSVGSDLDAVIESYAIDGIIHGAAITADLAREWRAARDIFVVNLLGTVEVLEAALRHRVNRVVQLGTGSIFGAAGMASESLDEQTSPALPTTLYGISKFAAERAGLRYRDTRELNLTVARLGMVFGRWEYETGVRDTLSMAFQLARMAEKGMDAVIHRNAPDDWVYSVDVARGLVELLDLPRSPEPIYHLSAGIRWSIEAWCRRLKERFPEFEYSFADRLEDCTVKRNSSARRSPMSIARIQRDTGYKPQFLLDHAFDDYTSWRDTNRDLLEA